MFASLVAVASSAVGVISAPPASQKAMADGRRAAPVAVGVANFADLIAQDRLRPPREVEPPERPEADEREPWENPTLDPRWWPRGRVPDRPSFDRPLILATGPSPGPLRGFPAVSHDRFGPPDSMGAVGPDHILTVTNQEMQAHTKTGVWLGSVSPLTFWQAVNPSGPFDPRAIYDPVQQRFIVVASSGVNSDQASVLVAISQTSNLLGGWVVLRHLVCSPAFPCGATGREWYADYPMLGLSRNFLSIYYGAIARTGFPSGGESRMLVFSYPSLLTASPGQPPAPTVLTRPFQSQQWGMPVVSSSATDGDLYFLAYQYLGTGLFLNRLTGPPDAPQFVQGPLLNLPDWYSTGFGCGDGKAPQAPEPGTGNIVTVEDNYGAIHAVSRDDSIWFVTLRHPRVGPVCGGRGVVAWMQLHKSGTIVDGGLIDDPNRYFMYPSLAVNRYHDVLIGFTRTSASEYVSAAYAFRAGTDPAGTFRDVFVFTPGEGHFNLPQGGGRNRWGDYSQTVVDPSDDTTLWTIQEYARTPIGTGPGSGRWGTWWAAVNIHAPQPPGPPRTLRAAVTGSSVVLTWEAPTDGGPPTAYRIEAGSGAGRADLANISTGNTALSYGASGVPDSAYWVRVRATNSLGASPPSNEVAFMVGCTAPPTTPTLAIAGNSGGTVTLAWSGSTGEATSYVLEAGSAPGLANLVSTDLGRPDQTFTATAVGRGTYFVRVRGRNRCGTSPASNEVVVVVP